MTHQEMEIKLKELERRIKELEKQTKALEIDDTINIDGLPETLKMKD